MTTSPPISRLRITHRIAVAAAFAMLVAAHACPPRPPGPPSFAATYSATSSEVGNPARRAPTLPLDRWEAPRDAMPAGIPPARREPEPSPLPPPEPAWASCEASHYSASLAGSPMANGQPYDPAALTAAHRELPFGTALEVRAGGRWVRVTVTDRGPFANTDVRCLDLSHAAIRALGATELPTLIDVDYRPVR